jgi:hypothetical protein
MPAGVPYQEGTPLEWDDERLKKLQVEGEPAEHPVKQYLRGPCPRCSHPISKDLALVPVPLLTKQQSAETPAVFLTCNCGFAHEGAPPGATGCGAEGGVKIVGGVLEPTDITPEQRQADGWVESAYAKRLANCRKLAQQWQTTLGVLTGLLGAATVVGGTGVRSLNGDWPFIYGIVAAAALILAASAVYLAHRAGTSQVVETIPPEATKRLALENKLYTDSRSRLRFSRGLAIAALAGFLVAIGILWYAPAKPTQSAPVTTAWVRSR